MMSGQRLPTIVVEHRREADTAVASEIAELVRATPRAVIGLAAGDTPSGIYSELARMHREEHLDLSRIVTFNLDEYLDVPTGDARTFRRSMRARLFDHVGVPDANIHIPPSEVAREHAAATCASYERAIRDAGGIDLLILGVGRNGHIGFNEPGSTRDSRTRVVELAAETRADAARTFGGIERVPKSAITMGVATILDARRIRVLAFGAGKADIVARTLASPIGPELPATFLRVHTDVTLHLDREAAAGIRS
jgi:glucosamine-6-phosphate deaminase